MDGEGQAHYQENRVDLAVYVVAGAILIASGIWLRSIVLNWVVGPALVVVLVAVLTPLAHRIEHRIKHRVKGRR